MSEDTRPEVVTQMLIRRPVAEVFTALTDPEQTTQFWFSHSSGTLVEGETVEWRWEMYGVSTQVRVVALEQNRRIAIEWDEPAMPVEWLLTDRGDETTLVVIKTSGFPNCAEALDSMGGFAFLLAGLKAFLEHGVRLNLVADHHPDANVESWVNMPAST